MSFRLKTLNNGLIIRASGTGNCEYANSKSGNKGGGFFMGNIYFFFFCEIRLQHFDDLNPLREESKTFYLIFSGV